MLRTLRVLFVALSLWFVGSVASLAEAQRRVVADVGIGFGLGQELASNCDFVDAKLAGCSPLSLGLTAEIALHVHDRVAVVVGGGWSRATADTTGVIPGRVTSTPFDAQGVSAAIGARFYAQPIYSSVRPFAAVSVGWQEVSGETTVLGMTAKGSSTAFGFGVSPGVDIQLSDRLTYRVAGIVTLGFPEKRAQGATANMGIRTGIVLRLNRRTESRSALAAPPVEHRRPCQPRAAVRHRHWCG